MLTKIKHVGIRPTHLPLHKDENTSRRRQTFYEMFPDGGFRIWNEKLLNSGCGNTIVDATIDDSNEDLIWCPFCKEWANYKQFITEDEVV